MSSSKEIQFSIPFSQLLEVISRLPADQKRKLADYLQDNQEISEESQRLVQERFEEYKKNPQTGTDWKDYEKELDAL